MKKISIAHAVSSLHPSAGGTSRVVCDLTEALARQAGISVSLITQSLQGERILPASSNSVCRVVAETASAPALRFGVPQQRVLAHCLKNTPLDLVHTHGLWEPAMHWANILSRKHAVPYIIQPHGMLEPWALHHAAWKKWKKRLALKLYQHRDLQLADLLVATSQDEYRNIRKLGIAQPVAIIPNGVPFDATAAAMGRTVANPLVKKALFLSRIHPKKGLLNLMAAWAELKPARWRLVIAGPDEGGHLAEVMAAARAHGIADVVDYVGEVEGEKKAVIYREADIFVLPTFSENFGVVVAEALSYGLPVITTKGAPWGDLVKHGCGWWIDTGVEPLAAALGEATNLSDDERRNMGKRGRVYARRYDWNDIAKQTVEVYRWILGQAPLPNCVYLD